MSLPLAPTAYPSTSILGSSATYHTTDLRFMLPRPAPSRPSMPAKAPILAPNGIVNTRGPCKCWWWWWEIGASLLSLLCVILITTVLVKFNNTPLASWPFWIQPNSLISVFTTVGHSAMMVPIASCISELKWRHFRLQAHPLSHLQCFDEASRGPWGSLVVIFKLRTKALVVVGFALISLIALGYDPSTQQILSFSQKEVLEPNSNATFWYATNYESKAYAQDSNFSTYQDGVATLPNTDLFKLQSAIVNGLAGTTVTPQYTCSGEWCSWDTFTALAVCSDYANVTDSTTVNCTGTWAEGLECQYVFPDTGHTTNLTFAMQTSSVSPASYIFKSVYWSLQSGNTTVYTIRTEDAIAVEYAAENSNVPPSTQIFYSEWSWCARTYPNLTASSAAPINMTYTSEPLQVHGIGAIDSSGYICYASYIVPSTGDIYNISDAADNELLADLASNFLSQGIYDMYPHAGYSEDEDDPLGLADFLYTTDIEAMTTNLATMLTYQIWSD
ncbi:hypothetical protein BD289DRAFT_23249 [Coniella lustricola]|uniref:Uncharacterized protein n=1 Tax=Coniella lustricola TaxID=2025994 RepID=A0A2T3A3C6_9PEZI|nr:hypothetical protein BD289DRAFT_23249 [Coniella lustricola]